jgi:phosphoribosylamine--glycine ligase
MSLYSKSKKVNKIYCFPGNAGTNDIASNVNIDLNNFTKLKQFIIQNKINIVIVGPEKPLVDGIVDYLKIIILKCLDQIKLHRNLKAQKFLQKIYVKNIIFQLLILDI